MRILCLHGAGTSGMIMEKQFADFTSALDDSYEYVFLEGEIECARAASVSDLVPGPYLSWYSFSNTEGVAGACELLAITIEEEGPFDGVIAFSQGASLAISYLLDLEVRKPHKPLPIKWAILFSSVVAISPDPAYLQKEIASFSKANHDGESLGLFDDSASATKTRTPSNRIGLVRDKNKQALANEVIDLVRSSIGYSKTVIQDDIEGGIRNGKVPFPRVLHPLLVTQRIRIPTLHVVGTGDDPRLQYQAQLMRKLCAKDQSMHLEHSGKHDVPRSARDLASVVAAAELLIEQSRWASGL